MARTSAKAKRTKTEVLKNKPETDSVDTENQENESENGTPRRNHGRLSKYNRKYVEEPESDNVRNLINMFIFLMIYYVFA